MRAFYIACACLFISGCSHEPGCHPLWQIEDCNTSGDYTQKIRSGGGSSPSAQVQEYQVYTIPPVEAPPKVWGSQ